jgi:hypothetical protein
LFEAAIAKDEGGVRAYSGAGEKKKEPQQWHEKRGLEVGGRRRRINRLLRRRSGLMYLIISWNIHGCKLDNYPSKQPNLIGG